MRRWLPLLLLAACLAPAGPLRAAEPAAPAPAPAPTVTLDDIWLKRLADAETRRDDAVQRIIAGEAAVGRARHREYPRGEALDALERDLARARKELAAVDEELPVLLEEARRAGVSRAVLDRFEPLAE